LTVLLITSLRILNLKRVYVNIYIIGFPPLPEGRSLQPSDFDEDKERFDKLSFIPDNKLESFVSFRFG